MNLRFLLLIFAAATAYAQNILTGGYDLGRTNTDPNEIILNPNTVAPGQFGRLYSLPVDGQIYAQPLYRQSVAIAGQGVHNVVFVATAHNSVYAWDADAAAPPLWTVNLGPSVPTSAYDSATQGPYTDMSPENGVLGTPVIDPATGTLYVVAATFQNGNYYYTLHALDTGSGAEKFGAPVVIQAQVKGNGIDNVDGVVSFNAFLHIQRPALLLLNGTVYIAFGSHGDVPPWHGWVMGYQASNVQSQTALFNSTPNSYGGSVWNSGRGLSADSQGNIYAVTGNGYTDDLTAYSDNVLRLNASDLTVQDWFGPSDVQTLDTDDGDLGSSGVILVPGTNLLITGGKQGLAYLLSTTSLGHQSANDSQIPQSFQAAAVGIFNMALWNESTGPVFYLMGGNYPLQAYSFSEGLIATTPSSQSPAEYAVPFNGITVSANGGNPGSGVVWLTTADSYPLPTTGTLHAFNADNLSSELWNSSMNSAQDALGTFTKFVNPTVANGKVYVGTGAGALAVYGLLGGDSAPLITGVVNAASYANGSVAPGEIVDIFGQNLGPQTLLSGSYTSSGYLGVGLAGMQVTFNGVPAPLLYASASVMSVVVPFEVSAASQASVQVSFDGVTSAVQTFSVGPSAPGVFTADSSGSGQAAVLNQDYSLNSDANPAAQGSVVSVYGTGGGLTSPAAATGSIASGAALVAVSVSATIGGQPAPVLYAGQAPDELEGVMQVNLQVPGGVSGDLAVVLTMGGITSQTTATVAVQ